MDVTANMTRREDRNSVFGRKSISPRKGRSGSTSPGSITHNYRRTSGMHHPAAQHLTNASAMYLGHALCSDKHALQSLSDSKKSKRNIERSNSFHFEANATHDVHSAQIKLNPLNEEVHAFEEDGEVFGFEDELIIPVKADVDVSTFPVSEIRAELVQLVTKRMGAGLTSYKPTDVVVTTLGVTVKDSDSQPCAYIPLRDVASVTQTTALPQFCTKEGMAAISKLDSSIGSIRRASRKSRAAASSKQSTVVILAKNRTSTDKQYQCFVFGLASEMAAKKVCQAIIRGLEINTQENREEIKRREEMSNQFVSLTIVEDKEDAPQEQTTFASTLFEAKPPISKSAPTSPRVPRRKFSYHRALPNRNSPNRLSVTVDEELPPTLRHSKSFEEIGREPDSGRSSPFNGNIIRMSPGLSGKRF